jgi:phenol/toluene 2-monooxygenase (NADH) P5/A5
MVSRKMPKLKSLKTGEEIEVKEGQYIRKAAEEFGVNVCCNMGVCGTCKIDIVKGEYNLTDLTQEEKDIEMSSKKRLACQCRIKKGDVIIDVEENK